MKAVFAGTVIADSADTVVIEGNHCFLPDSLDERFFTPTVEVLDQ